MKRFLLLATAAMLFATAAEAAPIQEIKTADGYTVWLSEDHTLPVVTVKFAFEHSGAAYDPTGKEGLVSFMTQMLDEGAGDMDSLAFHQELENNAIRYAADAGQDTITISLQTLSEHKDKALDLMLTSLTKPRFDPDATERIRQSIISDLVQLEEEPDYIASRAWKELAFPGSHAYAHPRRGTPATLKSITREDLQRFAKAHFFTGTPPIVSVVGDITPDEIREWSLPQIAGTQDTALIADNTMPEGSEPHVVKHDVPQTVVIASLPGLKRDDPKFYTLQVLNHILGGNSITSRLGSEVRNKRGLAYHIGSGIEVMDHAAFISANFATRNAQANEAVNVFTNVLGELADKGATEQEVADAKSYLTGSFPLEHDTQNELAGFLIGIQHFHLGLDYPDKRNALIQSVTLKDVNALAKTLLSHKPLIVMAGNPGEAKPAEPAH